jgi:hypothetical protein
MASKQFPRGISLARRMAARLHPFGKVDDRLALHGTPVRMGVEHEVAWSPPYVAYNEAYWLVYDTPRTLARNSWQIWSTICEAVEHKLVRDPIFTLLMLRTGIYDN